MIERHCKRTIATLSRDSPVYAPVSQKGAYRARERTREEDWNRGHMMHPPEGNYKVGQKRKRRGAEAATRGKPAFRGIAFKRARFTADLPASREG